MTRPGHTILEVVISIGVLAVATVSVGSLIDSLRTTDRATTNKTRASALAQQALEIASAIARQEFNQPKPCGSYNPPTGYNNCWAACPVNVPTCTAATIFRLEKPSGNWTLAAGSETIGPAPVFTRELTIAPTDPNGQIKQLTATVRWSEGSVARSTSISTMVSAWQD